MTASRSAQRRPVAIDDRAVRFDISNRLFFRLYQSSNLMHKTGTKALGDYGITTQQWAVLGALARPAVKKSGVSVKELMELLMTSRQNLTGVLDRLEAQGLIERSKGKGDGRIRHVRLTSVGAQTWTKMLFEIEAYYASAIAGFSTEESFLLLRLLDRLKLGLSAL